MQSLFRQLKPQNKVQALEHFIICLLLLFGLNKIFHTYLSKSLLNNSFWRVFWFKLLQKIPHFQKKIEEERHKIVQQLRAAIIKEEPKDWPTHYDRLPEKGVDSQTLLTLLKKYRQYEISYSQGKAFGGIYGDLEQQEEIQRQAYCIYFDSNALYPGIFPALKKFENEVVRMTINMLQGSTHCVGTMTTGGTESILMAVKAYRDRARDLYNVTTPEMLVPISAHAAFHKAAHYFGIKVVSVPLRSDCRADVNAIKRSLNKNTIMIVVSAPTYPHGVIDDIEEIASIAYECNIPLHVDACLGGFILPFLRKLGFLTKKWDFAVPGVTSISVDVHKYGFGPKGASVILYRSDDYRKYQFFSTSEWAGGLYSSPSMTGSRSGGIIAAAWTAMVHMGEEGYTNAVRSMWQIYQQLIEGINQIRHLKVMTLPDACNIAMNWDPQDGQTKNISILKVADAMAKRGWKNVNRIQHPVALQIQVGLRSKFDAVSFLKDLNESVEEVVTNPNSVEGLAGVYGAAVQLPSGSGLVENILKLYLGEIYK